MRLTSALSSVPFCIGLAQAYGDDPFSKWHPAGPGDVRAPCPMLNSLANHGFLPHDGKFITENRTISALSTALNISAELGKFLFGEAMTTSPEPNGTTFDLDNLSRHNILEHDGSLSRADYYWTHDSHSFNATVFAQTQSYWTGPVIDIQMGANARLARVQTSNKTNPTFSMSDLGDAFSIGETAAYIGILGDVESGTVKRELVEYLFENERLPTELGWTTSSREFTSTDLDNMMEKIVNATGATPEEARRFLARGDLHAGRSRCAELRV